ncbi:MAG: hypothetical protein M1816_003748 [Peltula sp. TS41687]|nr:MAG: hypothetical protein M1816_003748 [Peltula sp. TS41687]
MTTMKLGSVIPTPLLGQANKLVAEFKRVSALSPSAGRVPEIDNIRKMSNRFAHREQSYQNQPKKAVSDARGASGAKGSGGRLGSGSAVAAPRAGDGAYGRETNRLLRSLEGMGKRLLAAGGVAGNDDSGENDDKTVDDGRDAEMADDA